jgi:hypothetical protein
MRGCQERAKNTVHDYTVYSVVVGLGVGLLYAFFSLNFLVHQNFRNILRSVVWGLRLLYTIALNYFNL